MLPNARQDHNDPAKSEGRYINRSLRYDPPGVSFEHVIPGPRRYISLSLLNR